MHHPTTLPVSEQTCSREDCATLFVSLELSRSTWVATSLALGSRKMSKHTLVGGDARKLLDLLARLKSRAEQRIAAPVKVVAIQEAGLDGFWIHRLLEANGVESYVVDPASIAVPRRHRRAKTDAIDGETLLRTLMAWQRGEPRVCAMTVPPTPSEEDRRRVSRERATLLRERIRHTNRIRGLLFGQGITNYNPLHKNRREGLENCGPETDTRCRFTSRRRFFARLTGSSWCYATSTKSKLNAMKCCGRDKRALRSHY
jgi:transposase